MTTEEMLLRTKAFTINVAKLCMGLPYNIINKP